MQHGSADQSMYPIDLEAPSPEREFGLMKVAIQDGDSARLTAEAERRGLQGLKALWTEDVSVLTQLNPLQTRQ